MRRIIVWWTLSKLKHIHGPLPSIRSPTALPPEYCNLFEAALSFQAPRTTTTISSIIFIPSGRCHRLIILIELFGLQALQYLRPFCRNIIWSFNYDDAWVESQHSVAGLWAWPGGRRTADGQIVKWNADSISHLGDRRRRPVILLASESCGGSPCLWRLE